jgi:hypothetical protein
MPIHLPAKSRKVRAVSPSAGGPDGASFAHC